MRTALALTALLALAACSNKDETTTVTTVDGKEIKVTGNEDDPDSGTITMNGAEGQGKFAFGADAGNQKLPLDLPVYPGAKVVSVMSGAGQGTSGGIVVMLSNDSADDLSAFYQKEAEKRSMTVKINELKIDKFASFTAKAADGQSIVLSARPGGTNGGTHAMLIVEKK